MNNLTRQSFLGRSAVAGTWDRQIPTTTLFFPVGCLKSQPKDIDPEQDLHWPFPLFNSSRWHELYIRWRGGGSAAVLVYYFILNSDHARHVGGYLQRRCMTDQGNFDDLIITQDLYSLKKGRGGSILTWTSEPWTRILYHPTLVSQIAPDPKTIQ